MNCPNCGKELNISDYDTYYDEKNDDTSYYVLCSKCGYNEQGILTTPCDYPDENGNYVCPYAETYTGYESEMCRVCCGLGVDE